MPYSEEWYNEYMRKNFPDRVTAAPADLEPNTGNEPVAEKTAPRFNSPVCIHIHSIRNRLADSDGISGKACIDGLVHAGVLQDDSPSFVKEVRFTQEKSKVEEKTIITLEPA